MDNTNNIINEVNPEKQTIENDENHFEVEVIETMAAQERETTCGNYNL